MKAVLGTLRSVILPPSPLVDVVQLDFAEKLTVVPNRGEEAEEELRMLMELWGQCHFDVIMAIQMQGEKVVQVQGERVIQVLGEKAVQVQEEKAVQVQGQKVVRVQGAKVVQLYVSEVDSKQHHCYL